MYFVTIDIGITHMAIVCAEVNQDYTVNKIDNLYKKLKKNGVKFFSKPLNSIYDPVKTCFCYDPDYNLIQFVEGNQIKKKKNRTKF